jgi:ubiquinone biosynthesis monooxygenase Coq7
LGGRVIKVDHAGEHGAVNIYSAQILLARLTAPSLVPELREFRQHELRHRAIFQKELLRRGVRRCRSYILCGIGGFVLGLVTGLFGRGAIAATTVAVERVVLRHLQEQLEALRALDAPAVAAISSIVDEEQEHHDRAAVQALASRAWLAMLAPLVAASTELVIWTGMRL